MSDLIAISYPDEATAEAAADEARRLAQDLIIQPDAIAVIVRDKEGKYHVHTSHHLVGGGATWGMFWGLLFGLLFFIPVFGIAIGAGIGALMGKITKSGIDQQFQDQVRGMLQPGTSALFLMVEKVTPDKAVEAMSKYGGTVLKTSLSKEGEQELQDALHGGGAPPERLSSTAMPTGPPERDQKRVMMRHRWPGWLARGSRGRTGSPQRGGRYGLLLLVLILTYLLSAFSGQHAGHRAAGPPVRGVLLLALRTSPLPAGGRYRRRRRADRLPGGVRGVADRHPDWRPTREDLWKGLILLLTVVLIVRRVLARPTVTIQSIYGALSAYLILGLMFAAFYAADRAPGRVDFFANSQPANTQTFQYFSFTTLTTLGLRGLHRGRERRPGHRRHGGDDRPGVPGHAGGPPGHRVPDVGRRTRRRAAREAARRIGRANTSGC